MRTEGSRNGTPGARRMRAVANQDPRVRRAKRLVWLPVAVIVILAAGLSVFIASQLVPAQPVKTYHSTILDKQVCPLGEVHVVSDYEIKDYDITYLKYTSTWEEVGQPTNTQPGGEATFEKDDVRPVGRTTAVARFVRTAPAFPGQWKLTTEVVTSFDVWGVPRFDEYNYKSHGILTVMPLTSKKCLKEGS